MTPSNHHPNGTSHLGAEASTNPYHRPGNMYPGVGGAGGYEAQVPTVPGGQTNSYTGYIPGNMVHMCVCVIVSYRLSNVTSLLSW